MFTCVDGRKQRTICKKEDASALTVATELVLSTSTIEAYEERDTEV